MLNEFLILVLGYTFFIYTDFSPSYMAQYKLGWVSVVIMILIFIPNIGVMFWQSGTAANTWLKFYKLRMHRKKLL